MSRKKRPAFDQRTQVDRRLPKPVVRGSQLVVKEPLTLGGPPKRLTGGLKRHLRKVWGQNPEEAQLQLERATGRSVTRADAMRLLGIEREAGR